MNQKEGAKKNTRKDIFRERIVKKPTQGEIFEKTDIEAAEFLKKRLVYR